MSSGPGKPLTTDRADALSAGGTEYAEVWDDLPVCEQCGRRLRPARAVLSAWPATVARATPGACASCYNGGFRDSHKRSRRVHDHVTAASKPPVPVTVLDRRARAADWSEEERSAAVQVCDHVTDPSEIYQILELLGLFEERRGQFYSSVNPTFGH